MINTSLATSGRELMYVAQYMNADESTAVFCIARPNRINGEAFSLLDLTKLCSHIDAMVIQVYILNVFFCELPN